MKYNFNHPLQQNKKTIAYTSSLDLVALESKLRSVGAQC